MRLVLPTSITLPRKTKEDKKCQLNLNNFPHWHYQTYQQLKKAFKACVEPQMRNIVPVASGAVRLTYTLYHSNNRAVDIPNVLTVVGKFAEDAMVELGVLPGDSHKVIPEVVYRWGGVDKENPRVILEIEQI
jgi:hypothetical protein